MATSLWSRWLSETVPAGDDDGKRGWRHHAQHGMYGHVQHWADGSPYRVGFMLAELAKHFNVVDLVRSILHMLEAMHDTHISLFLGRRWQRNSI